VTREICRQFYVTVSLKPTLEASSPWALAMVYGLVDDSLKPAFLDELCEIHDDCPGALLLCGDFNLIYQAADKSNNHLNLRSMHRFRRTLDAMLVDELYLHDRLFT
jgi:hypothetical protein